MIEYRRAAAEDYPRIVEFHKRVDGKTRTYDDFLWEFSKGPFGASIYIVAVDGERIVGTNCVIPVEVLDDRGQRILTGKSEDTLVDPEYRGRNIFYDLYQVLFAECEKEGIQAIWGYTPAIKPFRKLGFDIPFHHSQSIVVFKILPSFRYLNGKNAENSFLTKAKIFALCLMSRLKFSTRSKKSTLKIVDSDSIKPFMELCNDFGNYPPNSFAIHHTQDYFNWRYTENPNLKGLRNLVWKDEQNDVVAAVILNITAENICYISHLAFKSGLRFKARKAVLVTMAVHLKRQGVAAVRNWHFRTNPYNEEEIKLYEESAFTILDRGIAFVWKDLTQSQLDPNHFLLSRASTQGLW